MRRRILVASLFSVLFTLASLGVVSTLSVDNEIEHSLQQSLELATVTANGADSLLRTNMARLYDVSLGGTVDLADGDWRPEREALKTAFDYSVFSAGLFLLDGQARILLTYPRSQVSQQELAGIPELERALRDVQPFFTGVHELAQTGRKAMFAFAPLKDKTGNPVGVLGGEIDPTHPFVQNLVRSLPDRSRVVIELVDENGVVIASSNPTRAFSCSDRSRFLNQLVSQREKAVFRCHRCHQQETAGEPAGRTTDILAFAPLQEAPWGVAVREPEEALFAPSADLRRRFAALALIVVASTLTLALALSRSIVNPVKDLIGAAARIAAGELKQPVRVDTRDEIGVLGRSFESMRLKLSETLSSLQRANLDLEERIAERTCQLQESKERLASLLHKVMGAQEDERKRIARELHDETTQSAAALGLSIEMASMSLREGRLSPADLLKLKDSVEQLIDGINSLIEDLRPPLLDDLGLISAVRWLLAKHLEANGIRCRFKCSDQFRQKLEQARRQGLSPRTELTLFRIVQEAVVNVAKHSGARSASVSLLACPSGIRILVQDDGAGFDVEQVLEGASRSRSAGYGMLGLQERAALLGAELSIDSSPGAGASVSLCMPLEVALKIESESDRPAQETVS